MKPLRLEMSAFGPFKDQVIVEFDKLGGQGLFLVTGDTGSGKTTLFDAISFALFGSPSGAKRNEENNMALRSQYAEKSVRTYVELVFSHKGKQYTVRRNPQYMRPSLRGNKETMESQGAEFVYPDGRKIVDFKKVTNAVEELLGINWAQYKQIAMIAQGEFLELLVADSDKRSAILRKIFGTGIYVNIQERLGSYTNRLKGECEAITNSIFQYFHDVQCPKESQYYESIQVLLQNKSIYDTENLMALITEQVNHDKADYQEMVARYKELEKQLIECRNRIAQAEQVNAMYLNLNQAKERESNLLAQAEQMDRKTAIFDKGAVALHHVRPLADTYRSLLAEQKMLEAKIVERRQAEAELTAKLEIQLKDKQLNEQNQPRIDELAALLIKRSEETVKYTQIEEFKMDVLNTKQRVEEQQQEIAGGKEKRLLLEQRQNAMKEQLLELKDIEVIKAKLEADIKQKQAEKLIIENLARQYAQILTEQKKLEQARVVFQQKMKFYEEKNEQYNEAEQLYFREQAGIMAAKLTEGDPCPVCGATHHPAKTPLTQGAPTSEELKEWKAELEQAHKEMQGASETCSSMSNTLEYKKEEFTKNAANNASLQSISFTNDEENLIVNERIRVEQELLQQQDALQEANTGAKKKMQLEQEQENQEEVIKTLLKRLELLEQQYSENGRQLSAKEARLVALKEEVSFAGLEELKQAIAKEQTEYDGLKRALETALNKYQQTNEQLQRNQAVLHDNVEQLASSADKLQLAKEAFETEYRKRGFASEEEYSQALLTEQELQNLKDAITEYKDQVTRVQQSVKELTKALDGKEQRDLTLDKEEETRLSTQKESCAELGEKARYQANHNIDILKKVNSAYGQHKSKTDEYALYDRLSKTANGNLTGKAKIAFEQFVQAFYFDQILAAANERLKVMSNSQYELRRKEEATNLRKNTGLDIEVMDHYSGKTRSVKTLSGGESFKAALSLALGLSDIIQSFAGGIEVDAMFVDEGFGSLDSNSLEQALSALNALTIGDRLVGIISHVNELKERIDKKIVLEKKRDGSELRLELS